MKTSQTLEIAERYFPKNDISERKEDRYGECLSPNVYQLIFGPNVTKFYYSLITTFLKMTYTNWDMFLSFAENGHFAHSNTGGIVNIHRCGWQRLPVEIFLNSANVNKFTTAFTGFIVFGSC